MVVSLLRRHRQSYRRWRKRGDGSSMLAGTEESPGEIELYQGRFTNLTVVWVPWARCPKVPLTLFPER